MKDGLLGAAESVVQKARNAGAEAAEAFLLRDSAGSVRIEKNDLGGVETETSYGIGVRVYKDRRLGFAYVTSPSKLREGLDSAFSAARLSQPLPTFRFASPKRIARIAGLHDAKIEALSGPDAIEMAWDLVRGVADIDPRLNVTEAGVSYGTSEAAIANSEGVGVHHRETGLHGSCFVVLDLDGVSTGFARRDSTRFDLKMGDIAKEAAQLALAARKPKRLEKGGKWPLVLRPEPAADLFDTVTLSSLIGKSAHRDESFYSRKLGKMVANPKLSLVDDPTIPRGLGSAPFDDEGEPSRRFTPISRGILKAYFFDRASGAEYKSKTTASAQRLHGFDGRSYKAPPSASGRNLRIVAPSTTLDRLVGGVDEGLLVHDMLGVHTANTVSGDFSVTSTVLFRIHKGAIEGPVAPLGVAGNFHQVLRKGVLLGDDLKPMAGEAAWTVPSVRVDGLTVTP